LTLALMLERVPYLFQDRAKPLFLPVRVRDNVRILKNHFGR
jgi:hypothetical protein